MKTVTFYGLKLGIKDDGTVSHVTHIVDNDELRAARALFRPDDTVLNAGNGLGATSALLVGFVRNVVAFEPNVMLRTASSHAGTENVHVVYDALSTQDGAARFGLRDDWWNSALSTSGRKRDYESSVATQDINRVVRDYGITAMLLDIEGEEANIIPYLDADPIRAFVCEIHDVTKLAMSVDTVQAWGMKMRFMREQHPDIWVIGAARD